MWAQVQPLLGLWQAVRRAPSCARGGPLPPRLAGLASGVARPERRRVRGVDPEALPKYDVAPGRARTVYVVHPARADGRRRLRPAELGTQLSSAAWSPAGGLGAGLPRRRGGAARRAPLGGGPGGRQVRRAGGGRRRGRAGTEARSSAPGHAAVAPAARRFRPRARLRSPGSLG